MTDEVRRGYRPCEQCGHLVAPGDGDIRSRTDTEVTGAVAWHRTEKRFLCPKCIGRLEKTGGHFFGAALVFALGLALLGFVGCFLSPK